MLFSKAILSPTFKERGYQSKEKKNRKKIMNIFNIVILAFMLNTSFLECGTIPIKHQYKTRKPQKLTKKAKTKTSDLSKHLSKKKPSEQSLGQDFPCKTLICLVQNYEVMKTSNGVLLKKSPSKSNSAKCTDLRCWLNLFNIQKTSYGFELTQKAVSKIQRPTRKHKVLKTLKSSPKFPCHTVMCLMQRFKVNDKSTKVISKTISKTAKTFTTTTKFTTIVTTPFPPIDEEYIEDVDQMFEDYFY